jgi:hypothetical protein
MGSGAKSYMRMGFLIYEKMRKYFPIYEEAVTVIYDFAPDPSEFPDILYEKNFLYFLSVLRSCKE